MAKSVHQILDTDMYKESYYQNVFRQYIEAMPNIQVHTEVDILYFKKHHALVHPIDCEWRGNTSKFGITRQHFVSRSGAPARAPSTCVMKVYRRQKGPHGFWGPKRDPFLDPQMDPKCILKLYPYWETRDTGKQLKQ